MMRALALAGLLVVGGAPRLQAAEDPMSANSVMVGCRAFLEGYGVKETFLQGVCVGQVEGVWSMGLAIRLACPPAAATVAQGVRVIVRYIDARPARLHERFVDLALDALKDAWPCPLH